MAAVLENKTFVNVLLIKGYDDEGYPNKYSIVPMPEINPDTFDKYKLFNIVSALNPFLLGTIGKIHKIEGNKITVY